MTQSEPEPLNSRQEDMVLQEMDTTVASDASRDKPQDLSPIDAASTSTASSTSSNKGCSAKKAKTRSIFDLKPTGKKSTLQRELAAITEGAGDINLSEGRRSRSRSVSQVRSRASSSSPSPLIRSIVSRGSTPELLSDDDEEKGEGGKREAEKKRTVHQNRSRSRSTSSSSSLRRGADLSTTKKSGVLVDTSDGEYEEGETRGRKRSREHVMKPKRSLSRTSDIDSDLDLASSRSHRPSSSSSPSSNRLNRGNEDATLRLLSRGAALGHRENSRNSNRNNHHSVSRSPSRGRRSSSSSASVPESAYSCDICHEICVIPMSCSNLAQRCGYKACYECAQRWVLNDTGNTPRKCPLCRRETKRGPTGFTDTFFYNSALSVLIGSIQKRCEKCGSRVDFSDRLTHVSSCLRATEKEKQEALEEHARLQQIVTNLVTRAPGARSRGRGQDANNPRGASNNRNRSTQNGAPNGGTANASPGANLGGDAPAATTASTTAPPSFTATRQAVDTLNELLNTGFITSEIVPVPQIPPDRQGMFPTKEHLVAKWNAYQRQKMEMRPEYYDPRIYSVTIYDSVQPEHDNIEEEDVTSSVSLGVSAARGGGRREALQNNYLEELQNELRVMKTRLEQLSRSSAAQPPSASAGKAPPPPNAPDNSNASQASGGRGGGGGGRGGRGGRGGNAQAGAGGGRGRGGRASSGPRLDDEEREAERTGIHLEGSEGEDEEDRLADQYVDSEEEREMNRYFLEDGSGEESNPEGDYDDEDDNEGQNEDSSESSDEESSDDE